MTLSKKLLIALIVLLSAFFIFTFVDLIVIHATRDNNLRWNIDHEDGGAFAENTSDYFRYINSFLPDGESEFPNTFFPSDVRLVLPGHQAVNTGVFTFINTGGVIPNPQSGNNTILISGAEGTSTWTFNIEQPGFYQVLVNYFPLTDTIISSLGINPDPTNPLFRSSSIEMERHVLINDEIEGLIEYEIVSNELYVFAHKLEIDPHNRGEDKRYTGIAGILLAYVAKESFNSGCDGFVVFISKTQLYEYYQKQYGAKPLGGLKLHFDTMASEKLIKEYLVGKEIRYD